MNHINHGGGDWLDTVLENNTKLFENLPISIVISSGDLLSLRQDRVNCDSVEVRGLSGISITSRCSVNSEQK